MPDEGFVSISRASQLLEAPERTVRRMADKLADSDRQVADRGTRLVRLSALASLMGKEIKTAPASEVADTEEASGRHMADKSGDVSDSSEGLADSGGHSGSALADAEKRAAVAEARADLLERELGAWKEQSGRLDSRLAEALEALQRAQDEARAARLIGGRGAMQIEASGLTSGDSGEVSSAGEGITTPSASEEPKRGFWARLWGKADRD